VVAIKPAEFGPECIGLLRNEFWKKFRLWANTVNLTARELRNISGSKKQIEAQLRRWRFVW
jgi:hypothetical protein